MIAAPVGLTARYKHDEPPGHWSHKPVIAFDDDGHPLVVGDGERDRSLVRADVYANCDGVGDDPYPSVIALLPAGGWRVVWSQEGGTEWSQPLVGWALRADGSVVPLDTDATGSVEELGSLHGKYRIYHPEQRETPAVGGLIGQADPDGRQQLEGLDAITGAPVSGQEDSR